MQTAQNWKDYELIDCSDGERLERFGPYRLVRPDPQVIWHTGQKGSEWEQINARYHRSKQGGGEWEVFDLPEEWSIHFSLPLDKKEEKGGQKADLCFRLKPFSFKHTGVFPEQAVNWTWFAPMIAEAVRSGRKVSVLNLFAYTGGATMAAAAAGASVTHVDAAKGMVSWAKENAAASGLSDAPIRYLTDDCKKFVEREIRRGSRYDAIILDPPSYGRGPNGEIWKMTEQIDSFLQRLSQLLSDQPLFVLLNAYTSGLQPAALTYLLASRLADHRGRVTADEIGLPVTRSGLVLPCGASGRWTGAGAAEKG